MADYPRLFQEGKPSRDNVASVVGRNTLIDLRFGSGAGTVRPRDYVTWKQGGVAAIVILGERCQDRGRGKSRQPHVEVFTSLEASGTWAPLSELAHNSEGQTASDTPKTHAKMHAKPMPKYLAELHHKRTK
jgi:hypothetical protein